MARLLLLALWTGLLPLGARAGDALDEVRIGLENEIGAQITQGAAPDLLRPSCSDPGWIYAAPAEREPRHRSAYPQVDRVEPRRCRPPVVHQD